MGGVNKEIHSPTHSLPASLRISHGPSVSVSEKNVTAAASILNGGELIL